MTKAQKLEAIDKLIAAVDAGGFDGTPAKYNSFARHWESAFGPFSEPNFTVPFAAYGGSIDAAVALHNALLPGWAWAIGTCDVSDDARVFPQDDSRAPDGGEWSEFTDVDWRPSRHNPARAWLLSILIAYRAKVAA